MRTRRTALTLAATVSLATLAGLTTAPQPAAGASPWVACTTVLDGVTTRVSATQHTATIVNQSATSWATVSFFTRQVTQACGFTRVFVTTTARLGYNGTTDGATRKQGSGTTPLGTYTMSQSFGLAAPPGTFLPYRQVRTGDYWVEDNDSAYYNSYRAKSLGGFRWWLPLSDPNGSEYLPNYPGQYEYAIVVNFNRTPDERIPYRGAGIFVHVLGSGATAGCIGVTKGQVLTMIRAIHQGDRITIVS